MISTAPVSMNDRTPFQVPAEDPDVDGDASFNLSRTSNASTPRGIRQSDDDRNVSLIVDEVNMLEEELMVLTKEEKKSLDNIIK